jgi:hypothetical protein
MKISRVEREELVEELAERAHDQASSVEVSFYEGAGENQVTGPDGTVHEARPRGHATIEEKDYIFDVEQRTSE